MLQSLFDNHNRLLVVGVDHKGQLLDGTGESSPYRIANECKDFRQIRYSSSIDRMLLAELSIYRISTIYSRQGRIPDLGPLFSK
jgi:hypothetical protein